MTHEFALKIREIKKGCSYRRLAEIIYSPNEPGHGNQLFGRDLCYEAFSVLYPDKDPFEIEYGKDPVFDQENKSHSGDYFWWE